MPRLEDIPPTRVADAVARAVVDAVGTGGDPEAIVAMALAAVKGDLGLGTSMEQTSTTSAGHRAVAPPRVAFQLPRPSPNGFRPAPLGSGKAAGGSAGSGRPLITEGDVLAAAQAGQTELRLSPGTIVTPLARDVARDAGLRLVEGG